MNQKKGHKNKKKTIAMLLVMAIFISILPDSFTAGAAEIIKEATETTPALVMQFQINSAWGGSIAADIILTNKGSKTIENWEITYNWKPVITSLWCAQYQAEEKAGQEGAADTNRYTIHPYEYNNTIHPGSEIRIGLIASGKEAELAEPDSYEIKINGENWVYDTKKGGLKKPEETEEPTKEPEHSEVPEISATPEETEEPTKEPEHSEVPEISATPEETEEPEISATPEITEEPTKEPEHSEVPEITATPEETEEPTTTPEITAEPEISTEPEPTAEPAFTKEPENTPAPTATPEPTKEPDYNLEDHEFTDDLIITSDTTLTKNTSCKNLYIKSGTLNTDGYQLTVRENAEQSGGRLNIEKESKAAIKGNITLTAGILALNDGRLQTEGNFKATETGELQLNTEKSHTIIGGNCHLESRQRISNGILEIKGNLIIPHKSWLKNGNNVNIKLSGSKTQSVTTEEETYLHNLDLTESNGVEFMQPIHAGTLTGIQNITGKKATFAVEEVSLAKDTELNYDVEIKSGTWKPGSKKLIIAGNLELTGGSLLAEEGEIEIQGDLHAAGGELNLRSEKAHVVVEGDCQIESGQRINGGLLEIKENLNIPYKNWLKNGNNVNIKLSGSKTQSVTTEEETYLHNLDLTESNGVEFMQPIHAGTLAGIQNITGEKATFAVEEVSLAKDTELNYDVEIKSGTWKPGSNKLIIAGNLELTGGSLLAEEGEIEIQGDLHAAGGELNLRSEKAHVVVEGDCQIESGQRINGGLLEIKENLNIPYKNWLKNGNNVNLKLSGSHIQKVTTKEGVYLHNIDITESKGVTFQNTVNAATLTGIEKLAGSENTLNVREATNSPYGSTLKGNLILEGGSLQFQGLHFTIEGDITINGGVVTSKAERFTIKGNCTLNGGVLDIAAGQTTIEKNCQIAGTGAINLTENTAALIIGGSLKSSSKAQSRFQAGDIHLAGNLIQAETANEAGLCMQSRLHLDGEEKQTIRLSYPEKSSFSYLDMKYAKEVIIPSVIHAQTIKGLGKAANRYLTICGWMGEIEEYTHYHGELTLVGSVLKTGSHYLTVEKLEQVNSRVIIGEGGLDIQGDYILSGDSLLEMKTAGGVVIVEGTFYTASAMSHRESLTEGTLYIGKHLLQEGYNFSFYPTDNLTLCFTQPSPEEGGIIQVVSIAGEMSEIIEKQKKENFRRINGGKVEINNILIEDLTPESIYRNFCEGVKEGTIEVTKDLKQFILWTAIGAGVELTFHGFAIAADLGLLDQGIIALAKTAGTAGVFAIVAYILFSCGWELYTNGGNVNLLARKAGRAAAEVLVTAFSSMAAAGLIEAAITPQRFQKIVQVSISQIKKAYRTGKAAIEEITALFTGSKNAASLLSKKLTPQAAKYLNDLVEAGVISEEALQRSSSFLDDMLPEAEQLGTTELKTILEQAGTMENSELSDLVRWLSEKSGTKNGRALEYLDDEAKQYLWKKSAELSEKQLDDILDDIIKEVEGLEEATGVIKNIGRKGVAEKVEKAVTEGNTHTLSPNTKVIIHEEIKAPNQIKASEVTNYWDNFLGENQTNINPRTGAVDLDRIFSSDGTKSIRFGNHEMDCMETTKFHFHQETWVYDAVNDELHYYNTLFRIKD